jgi:hypothetical protein
LKPGRDTKRLTRSLRAARKKSPKPEDDSSLIFLDNLATHEHGSHPCTKTALTLKQTQREKGRVMMTSSMEMLVRTPPHRLMPVSSSSAEYFNITRDKYLLLPCPLTSYNTSILLTPSPHLHHPPSLSSCQGKAVLTIPPGDRSHHSLTTTSQHNTVLLWHVLVRHSTA